MHAGRWHAGCSLRAVKGFIILEISFGDENCTVSSLVMSGETEQQEMYMG